MAGEPDRFDRVSARTAAVHRPELMDIPVRRSAMQNPSRFSVSLIAASIAFLVSAVTVRATVGSPVNIRLSASGDFRVGARGTIHAEVWAGFDLPDVEIRIQSPIGIQLTGNAGVLTCSLPRMQKRSFDFGILVLTEGDFEVTVSGRAIDPPGYWTEELLTTQSIYIISSGDSGRINYYPPDQRHLESIVNGQAVQPNSPVRIDPPGRPAPQPRLPFLSGSSAPLAGVVLPAVEAPPLDEDDTNGSREWQTVKTEGFEGAWPNDWYFYTGGSQCYWGDVSCKAHTGSWSGWVADDGSGAMPTDCELYCNDMNSWMIYGPFDLGNASAATVEFYYWNASESCCDSFQWLASPDGSTFNGYQVSGSSSGWQFVSFDLGAVPNTGSLCGDSSAWIAFRFSSDGSVGGEGAYVDDIAIRKNASSQHCYSCPQFDVGTFGPNGSWQTITDAFAAGECRIYEFWLWGGGNYRFTCCENGGSASGDSTLTLWNSSCSQVGYDDDSCGVASELDVCAPADGYYYLRVGEYNNDAALNYTVAYSVYTPYITVTGSVVANGQPVRWAVCELWDKDTSSGDEILLGGWTDENGNFELGPVTSYDEEGCYADVYVKVSAISYLPGLSMTYTAEVIDLGGNEYTFSTSVVQEASGTVSFGTMQAPSAQDGAWSIHDSIVSAYQWLMARPINRWPNFVQLFWIPGNTNGTHYHPGGTIDILGNASEDHWDRGIVMHEYGHFIAHDFEFLAAAGGAHSICNNYTEALAWNEGWAHFFACSCMGQPFYTDAHEGASNTDTNTYNFETCTVTVNGNFVCQPNDSGATNEGAVGGLLWDVSDGVNDNQNGNACGDGFSNGSGNMWDVNELTTPFSILEFWDGWFAQGYGNQSDMCQVYCEHGIAQSACATATPTWTPTPSPTRTLTPSATPTRTSTPALPTATPSATATRTSTPTSPPSFTPTRTPTVTPTSTAVPSTRTPTAVPPTATATSSPPPSTETPVAVPAMSAGGTTLSAVILSILLLCGSVRRRRWQDSGR